MKSILTLLAATAFTLAGTGTTFAQNGYYFGGQGSIPYTPGGKVHTDNLAIEMQRLANAICWDMYRYHRHQPGYAETYREMYDIAMRAAHIHELAHDDVYHRGPNNQDHIAHDLNDIDQLFHHVEEDVAGWSFQQVRFYNPYHPHVSGNLIGLMERFQRTMHHMMEDYGVSNQFGSQQVSPPLPNNSVPLNNTFQSPIIQNRPNMSPVLTVP